MKTRMIIQDEKTVLEISKILRRLRYEINKDVVNLYELMKHTLGPLCLLNNKEMKDDDTAL